MLESNKKPPDVIRHPEVFLFNNPLTKNSDRKLSVVDKPFSAEREKSIVILRSAVVPEVMESPCSTPAKNKAQPRQSGIRCFIFTKGYTV